VLCEAGISPHDMCEVECRFCGELMRGAERLICIGPDVTCLQCGEAVIGSWRMLTDAGMQIFYATAHQVVNGS